MKNTHRSNRLLVTAYILLPALTMLFGLQILRVTISQLVWVLGDHLGLNAIVLGLVALAIFASAYLAGPLKKFFDMKGLLVSTIAGLGILRFLIQIPWSSTLITMILAIIGVILFGLFLNLYTDEMRFRGTRATGNTIIGFLLGILVDTGINGAFGTYDIVWQFGIVPFVLIFVLVTLQWVLLYSLGIKKHKASQTRGIAWPWLAIGPFIFLQTVVLQNIARQTVTTGWDQPYVFGLILAADIVSLFAAIRILKNGIRHPLVISCLSGVVLIAGMFFPFPDNSWLAAVLVVTEQIAASILMVVSVIAVVAKTDGSKKSSVTLAGGTGFFLLGILTFAYYAGYQIAIPFDNKIIEPIAAGILALCGILPSLKKLEPEAELKISWSAPLLSLILLILPLTEMLLFDQPLPILGHGYPVKMMTYNLHNGFNPDGDLDLEAMAKVIEAENPDIVALQEISRGWLISGRVDMLTWLSQRLDLPYASGPTEGPLWGNAVLSRYPITRIATFDLPPRDLVLRRGILVTWIDLGNGETLKLMATHLHHLAEDSDIRQLQIPVLLETWKNSAYTVLTGDMNAEPDSPEMGMLRDAGLTDIMADFVPPDGYTFSSFDPFQRIDYIWITPDLKSSNTEVIQTRASDHMPVVTELSR